MLKRLTLTLILLSLLALKTPGQNLHDDSIKKIVKDVTQHIEDLFQRERLHIKKELLYMEQNIERSTRNSLKEVEDYSIAKRGELFASLLEGYEK